MVGHAGGGLPAPKNASKDDADGGDGYGLFASHKEVTIVPAWWPKEDQRLTNGKLKWERY